jgi:hypothetical protein
VLTPPAKFSELFLRKRGAFARKLRQCLHLAIFGLKKRMEGYSYCEFLIHIKLKWKWWKLFMQASSSPRITLVNAEGPFATQSENPCIQAEESAVVGSTSWPSIKLDLMVNLFERKHLLSKAFPEMEPV